MTKKLQQYERVQVQDPNISSLQTRLESAIRPIEDCDLINGHLLEGETLSEGTNTIYHKLKRRLKGWILTRIYDVSAVTEEFQIAGSFTCNGAGPPANIVGQYISGVQRIVQGHYRVSFNITISTYVSSVGFFHPISTGTTDRYVLGGAKTTGDSPTVDYYLYDVSAAAKVDMGLADTLDLQVVIQRSTTDVSLQITDSQDSNSTPDKTLTLNSNGACTVDIWVF